jgi:hypothetical protein
MVRSALFFLCIGDVAAQNLTQELYASRELAGVAGTKFCRSMVMTKDGIKNPCKSDGTDWCCDNYCMYCGTEEYCMEKSPFQDVHMACDPSDMKKMACPNYWTPCKAPKITKVGGKETCITQTHFVDAPSMECRSEGIVTPKCCGAFQEVAQSEVADIEDDAVAQGEKSDATKKLEAKLSKSCSKTERGVLAKIKSTDCQPIDTSTMV